MQRHRGRPTRLTPQVQSALLQAVQEGYTLTTAAHLAAIPYRTLTFWLWLGNGKQNRRRSARFTEFTNLVRAAQQEAANAKIRANPRPLARARYEGDATPEEMRDLLFKEIMRCRKEGRVPYDITIFALEMALDTCRDILAQESISCAENYARARTHAGNRGVSQCT